jgi:alpha-N-acetylglucosamine transferase
MSRESIWLFGQVTCDYSDSAFELCSRASGQLNVTTILTHDSYGNLQVVNLDIKKGTYVERDFLTKDKMYNIDAYNACLYLNNDLVMLPCDCNSLDEVEKWNIYRLKDCSLFAHLNGKEVRVLKS